MKYSTVIVAACIGGASLASATVEAGTQPHPNTPRIRRPTLLPNIKQTVQRINQHGKQSVDTTVGAGQQVPQNAGIVVQTTDTWSNTHPSSTEEPVSARRGGDWPRRRRKSKGPNRLQKQEDDTAPVLARTVKSPIAHIAKGATEGTTLVETGSPINTGDAIPPASPPVRRGSNDELNMEVRDLDVEDLEARAFHDSEGILGRNWVDSFEEHYHERKAEDYKKKAAKEMAIAGIQNPSPTPSSDSLTDEVAARGYHDAELDARSFIQAWNAAGDTIFGKNPSTPLVARDSPDSLAHALEARGYDDTKLEARDIVDTLRHGFGAAMDTFFGEKHASSAPSAPSVATADPSMVTDSSANENAPVAARDILDQEYLESRSSNEMEHSERDIREGLAARGYDDAVVEARGLLTLPTNVIKSIISSKKPASSRVVGPSMTMYPQAYANQYVPVVARGIVDQEYLESRDFEEDYLESRDFDGGIELFERDLAEELDTRDFEDELEARDFEIDELE